MGRLLRRVRGRSTEEQMLVTMLVAGVVFAIVALVAFLRPGSGSTSSARGPQVRTAHTDASAPQGSSTHIAIDQGITPDQPAPADAQSITDKLQRLFGAVVTPFGFTTDLPPLIRTSTTPVTVRTSNPNTFPSTFPSLPGTLPPPPPTLPPPPPTLPPTTDTLPPPTTQPPTTLPPTTQPPTTLPPTTQPPTTQPPTTQPPTTQPPTTQPPTTQPPSTDTTTTPPPSTDTTTAPPSTDTTTTLLPPIIP
jgi:hypothetical protein